MTENKEIKPIYIVGPTASGKSALAFLLAKKLDGVIISADSMQIYRGLDVGTAKESVERRNEVEYKLIDFLAVDAEYSVAEFAVSAKYEIENAIERGKTPIIVGGTGLYFEALFYPMSFGATAKDVEIRGELQRQLEEYGADYLYEKLRRVDKITADKLHVNDTKRVIRALEIALASGKTMSAQADERKEPNVIAVGLNCEDRSVLYDRINKRVDVMFDMGLVDEAYRVQNFDCQSMKAIGYKEFFEYDPKVVDGKYVLTENEIADVKEKIKKNTRNYAKRQLTWFRRYKFVKWFECDDVKGAIDYICSLL